MLEDKYIGLGLAIASSLAIGSSFIITKKGLIDAAERHSGYSSESYSYLRNATWWAGMITMVVGEIANFAAYTFAPAILVTPLGALSVLIGAVLASFFLQESLGKIGRVGCTLCLVGSIIIVLHAPEEKEVETVDEILEYAMHPAFMFYCFCVLVTSLVMIYRVAPKYGSKNPIVYISICSLVGSVSVMAIKGFGVAVKLTLAGNNQLTHLPTYVFGFTVAGCIAVQMNYFNKALDLFSTNVVNPIYYVCFSTATIFASFLLFRGFNTSGSVNTISLIAGFVVIFLGVYLLNQRDPNKSNAPDRDRNAHRHSLLETRQSMSLGTRLSVDEDPHLPLAAQNQHVPLSIPGTKRHSPNYSTTSHSRNGSLNMPSRSHPRRSDLNRQSDEILFDAFPDEAENLRRSHESDNESDDGTLKGHVDGSWQR